MAFTSDRTWTDDLYTMDADGSNQTDLTNDASASEFAPAFSPDGTQIAFAKKKGGDRDVWVMGTDGSGKTNLTADPAAQETQPSFSPDGSLIAYASKASGNYDIWVMDADGTGQHVLQSNAASDTKPAFSPDGTQIAFVSDRTGDPEIWVTASDGSGVPTNLTNHPASLEDDPAWSPDGSKIAFTTDRKGEPDVYVMNTDGTDQTNLTGTLSGSNSDPVFSPDQGARLVYIGGRKSHQVKALNLTPDKGTFGDPANLSHDSGVPSWPAWQPLAAGPPNGSPVSHIVVVFQENHSFDNVLGKLCVDDSRCDGATTGKRHDGVTITLTKADDISPPVNHEPKVQIQAIDGGKMDGFSLIFGCQGIDDYACYTQYYPSQIPNLAALARAYAISDRTFENDVDASWVAHLQLVTALGGGFTGKQPDFVPGNPRGPGWGCDSYMDAEWHGSVNDPVIKEPSCVPAADGTGPYRETSAAWISTIMDRFDEAGLSWTIYTPSAEEKGYGRATCPTFAECLYGPQAEHLKEPYKFIDDAEAGTLPNLSLIMPESPRSQHNQTSMLAGDNWIGNIVNTVGAGPQWDSTAIFITYDDCGCFYDHAPPPPDMGIRVPMVIVSPYAKPGYTDSKNASYASMLAYVEHTFGLAPMSTGDAGAYDYNRSFDYTLEPKPPPHMGRRRIPAWERAWLKAHPPDPNDPT